jgi:TMEM175 potassium channel family protein
MAERVETTARLETFSDGVFAIAATLLILDVNVRAGTSGQALGHELLRIWPSYAAYAVSFLTIGIMWVNHHTTLGLMARVDRAFLFINIFLLMMIAFVPFPTRVVAQHFTGAGDTAAALLYGATFTVTAVFYSLFWRYAIAGRRLLRDDADPSVVGRISRSYRPGPYIYLGATLVAFASPQVSDILFGVIALFYAAENVLVRQR